MKKEQNVLERVYEPRRLLEAWRQVKSNAGAAGVDQMTVAEFERRKKELFPVIRNKRIAGTYRFKPARRVQIPKKGSPGKFRNLGIPTVVPYCTSYSDLYEYFPILCFCLSEPLILSRWSFSCSECRVIQ